VKRSFINLVLLGGVAAISTSAVLIRLAAAEPAAIAFYRLLFAALMLAPWAVGQNRVVKIGKKTLLTTLAGGIFLALHFLFWMTSLEKTSVASSVVLVTTQPLWVFLLSVFLLREKPTKTMWLGLALALIGSVVVVFTQSEGGQSRLVGNLLAVAGAIMMAFYFLVGRRLRRDLPLALYSSLVYGSSSLVLGIFMLFTRTPFTGYESNTWLIFLSLAFIPTVLGHNSLNWALKYLPATMVSVVILGEPLGASLFAVLILKEVPALLEVAGSLLTLGGIFLVYWGDPTRLEETVE
jgi:drug/metabolite transporter (DMT)-like permease